MANPEIVAAAMNFLIVFLTFCPFQVPAVLQYGGYRGSHKGLPVGADRIYGRLKMGARAMRRGGQSGPHSEDYGACCINPLDRLAIPSRFRENHR